MNPEAPDSRGSSDAEGQVPADSQSMAVAAFVRAFDPSLGERRLTPAGVFSEFANNSSLNALSGYLSESSSLWERFPDSFNAAKREVMTYRDYLLDQIALWNQSHPEELVIEDHPGVHALMRPELDALMLRIRSFPDTSDPAFFIQAFRELIHHGVILMYGRGHARVREFDAAMSYTAPKPATPVEPGKLLTDPLEIYRDAVAATLEQKKE